MLARFRTSFPRCESYWRNNILDDLAILALAMCIVSLSIGLSNLSPFSTDWLKTGDPAFQQLSWEFFRREPWGWPLGLLTSYGDNSGTSMVFTDSVPLLAILLKALVPHSVAEFQYFGGWFLLSLFLQGFFSRRLALRFDASRAVAFAVASFMMLSPVLLFRLIPGHFSLTAQWVLLAIIYVATARPEVSQPAWKKNFLLGLPVVLAAGIHAYLFFIALSLFAAVLLEAGLSRRQSLRNLSLAMLGVVGGSLMLMYLLGYFVIPLDAGKDVGFGQYSMNLLALMNPLSNSLFIKPMETLVPGQYEGFAYLGIGSLLLLPGMLIPVSAGRTVKTGWVHLVFGCYVVVSLLIATLPQIAMGKTILLDFSPYHAMLENVFGFFRANGRMFWGSYYILMLFLVIRLAIADIPARTKALWIMLAAILQLADLSPLLSEVNRRFQNTADSLPALRSPFWIAAAHHYRQINMIPRIDNTNDYIVLGRYAFQNGMSTNAGRLARHNRPKMTQDDIALLTNFQEGKLDQNSVYVVMNPSVLLSSHLPPGITGEGTVDGYTVVAPGWFSAKGPLGPGLEQVVSSPVPRLDSGQTIKFANAANRKYLGAGWHLTEESWGIWSSIPTAFIRFRSPASTHILKLHGHALLNIKKPSTILTLAVDGISGPGTMITLNGVYDNDLLIPLPTCGQQEFCEHQVTVTMDNTATPAEMNLSPYDHRPIGFGLVSMTLLP